jgi:hypothetical protein
LSALSRAERNEEHTGKIAQRTLFYCVFALRGHTGFKLIALCSFLIKIVKKEAAPGKYKRLFAHRSRKHTLHSLMAALSQEQVTVPLINAGAGL